ncbi:protein S-acyltransferase 8-like, partial [Carica papaya]|uniref:protein S-acyltransferase 8-like n=1 Tax=Carica papaya TaxID=3649 RepID=UPI000B8C7765
STYIHVQRNYRYFFMFVSSSAMLCIFIFAMSAWYIKFLMDDHGSVWKAMKESPASVILMAYCFVFFWFVGGLTCFHLYLIGTNQTTYENFRNSGARLVYDHGCLKNFTEIFCTRIKPSRNNFRAYVAENARRLARATTREVEINDSDGGQREKVENDQEIDGDLLKISQRREIEN